MGHDLDFAIITASPGTSPGRDNVSSRKSYEKPLM